MTASRAAVWLVLLAAYVAIVCLVWEAAPWAILLSVL